MAKARTAARKQTTKRAKSPAKKQVAKRTSSKSKTIKKSTPKKQTPSKGKGGKKHIYVNPHLERNLDAKIAYLDAHNKKYEKTGFATKAIHVGQPPDAFYGSVNMPIHMTSTYAQVDAAVPYYKFDYTRGGNPTREALEHCMASLEGAKYALSTSAGLATNLMVAHMCKSGDHILACDDVYGGTGRYFRTSAVAVYNMQADFVDMTDLKLVEKAIKKNTKVVWLESPTNPLLKVFDIRAIAKICKKKGAVLVVDNTFQSPVFQNPLALGADIVVHSATKYLAGHSDVVMGFLCTNSKELFDKLNFSAFSIGPVPSPFDCYLVMRSLKTLKIRMKAINENALAIAKYLESRKDKVERVYYPGLKSHP